MMATSAGRSTQHHFRGGHGGTGISCSDERRRAPFANHPQTHAHRGIPLGTHRLQRLVLHEDDFAGMNNGNRQQAGERVPP
jgi:hypothetical protein